MSQPSHHPQVWLTEQLPEQLKQSWEEEIRSLLPADYEQAATRLAAFQRRRALRSVADLLRALLAFVLCTSSLRHLGGWAVLVGLADLSHVAWHKRLQRSRDWLCWLLIHLLALPTPSIPVDGQASQRVVLVDGTRLKQPGGCGDDWRAHLGYDLLHARLVDVRISDRKTAEGFSLFEWHPGDVVIADRGYCRRSQVAWVLARDAHIVVRVAAKSFPFLDASGAACDVLGWLAGKTAGCFERVVSFEHEQRRYRGRLLAQALSPEAAERARAKVRRRASKKQCELQEDTLLLAGWVLVFTSLPASTWSLAKVLRLYRARWQVELVIKRMKQVLKLAQLRGQSPRSNEACLLALLVCWALQQTQVDEARQVFAQVAASLHDDPAPPSDPASSCTALSSWGVHTFSIHTLRVSVQGSWTLARLREAWPRLMRFVSSRQRRQHQESCIRRLLCRQFGLDASLLFYCSSA